MGLHKCTWRLWLRRWHCAAGTISFPESSFPLTSGRKTRALGATISGMRHRWRPRSETGWAEFGYFLCYFKMVAPRALVFRPLVKGNEDSGNEIAAGIRVWAHPGENGQADHRGRQNRFMFKRTNKCYEWIQQGWTRLEPGVIRRKMPQSLSTWVPKSRRMGGGTKDIKSRLRKARGAFHWNLTKVWNTRGIGKKRKVQLYKTLVRTIYSPMGVKHGRWPTQKRN